MEKINKSMLMKNAWVRARNLAFMEGGTAKEWFAYALKQRWAFEKEIRTPKPAPAKRVATETKVVKIKDWFVDKNFDVNDLMIYQSRERIETIEETQKAVRIKVFGSYGRTITTWVPKSCIA